MILGKVSGCYKSCRQKEFYWVTQHISYFMALRPLSRARSGCRLCLDTWLKVILLFLAVLLLPRLQLFFILLFFNIACACDIKIFRYYPSDTHLS